MLRSLVTAARAAPQGRIKDGGGDDTSTMASNPWVAAQLNMGSPFRLSRMVSACRANPRALQSNVKLMTKCKVLLFRIDLRMRRPRRVIGPGFVAASACECIAEWLRAWRALLRQRRLAVAASVSEWTQPEPDCITKPQRRRGICSPFFVYFVCFVVAVPFVLSVSYCKQSRVAEDQPRFTADFADDADRR
jgi:hypothetical protein